MNNIIEAIVMGILTGIISGFFTSVIVTKFYRKKDESIEKSRYISSLAEYVYKLRKIMFFSGGAIPDEYINRIHQFTEDNKRPEKYKWIKFSNLEEDEVKKTIEVCDFIKDKTFECHMKNSWLISDNYPEDEKVSLEKNISELKMDIFLKGTELSIQENILRQQNKKYIS